MKLKPLHRKELIRKIKKLGFDGPFIWGNHDYLINKNNFKIVIPNTHSWKDIPVPIISAIIKQLNVSRNIFIEL
jgi:predicted RNA binding protein YcfA (HicA-like mRNA interferase family)